MQRAGGCSHVFEEEGCLKEARWQVCVSGSLIGHKN